MLFTLASVCETLGSITGVAGGWLVSSGVRKKVYIGFVLWIMSDIFLVIMGIIIARYIYTALMAYFTWTSIRGVRNNRPENIKKI